MMIIDALLWSNILVCSITGLILLTRRPYSAAGLLFVLGLFFVSGLNFIDLQSVARPEALLFWRKYAVIFETLIVVSCYFYAKTAFRDNSLIYKGPGFCVAVVAAFLLVGHAFIVPIDQLIFSPDFAEEKILFLTNHGFAFYLALMIFLVFGLVQQERTLAALHQLQRWQIKLEIIGSGLLIAVFALYFSHSLLYRSINMNFLAMRSIVIPPAVGLVIYSRLFRGRGSNLALSRGIAYRSFVLLIVGVYLILLGAIGEGLHYLNISNTENLFYVVLLLGSLGLAVIFLSETLRRKLRVLLHKNFYQAKYDYREQWENFAKLTAKVSSFADIQVAILDLFCTTFACKGAAFYLFDHQAGAYTNSVHFNFRRDWRPFPLNDPLIVKLQQQEWIVNLTEANPELAESLIESFSDVGAFLVIPQFFDEELFGFIVLGAQINRGEELNYEDYDLMRMLARQASAIVQGQRLTAQLSTARELAAIGKVSTFVLHDLKNQVSGLSLMLDNARDYIADSDFQQDMLETVANTVGNMKELIARLKNLKEKPQLIIAPVDMQKVIEDAVETAGGNVLLCGETARIDGDEEEIYKVILNLLVNAIEASPADNPVKIDFGREAESAFIHVSDTGCGMSSDFVENRLFKPFDTTKKHGFGIGLYQCKQIIESHQGSISVASREGEGTRFTLRIPLAPAIEL